MIKRLRIHLILMSALALILLGARCSGNRSSSGELEKELIGTWRSSGTVPDKDGNPGMTWYLEYTFSDNGDYLLTGYPPISEKGTYEIRQEIEDSLFIRLSPTTAEGNSNPVSYRFVFDEKRESFNQSDKTYFRSTGN